MIQIWYQFAEDKIWQFSGPKSLFNIQQIWFSNYPKAIGTNLLDAV